MTGLVGKTKYSINSDLWGGPVRKGLKEAGYPSPDLSDEYFYNDMIFLRYDDQGFVAKDNLRIALGNIWTEASKDLEDTSIPPVLDYNWGSLNLFYGRPLELVDCNGGRLLKTSTDSSTLDTLEKQGLSTLLKNSIWENEISIGVKDLPNFTEAERRERLHIGKMPGDSDSTRAVYEFAAFVRLGLSDGSKTYYPIINSSDRSGQDFPGYLHGTFFDHVYKSVDPFTPKELLSKQPFGKASKVSISTWYNTQLDTKRGGDVGLGWESFVANIGQQFGGSSLRYDNALPTPYGFLRIMLNKFQVEDLYDKKAEWLPGGTLKDGWKATALDIGNRNSTNRSAFIKYPYELLMTLFGRVSPEKIGKFTNIEPKGENVQYQVEEYFDAWMNSYGERPVHGPGWAAKYDVQVATLITDRVFDNVAISPSALKNLAKVEQIKKYFPYYSEIEFTTAQYTELGDIIKQILFGKYFVNKIAGYNTTSVPAPLNRGQAPLGNPQSLSFSDYRQEITRKDLTTLTDDLAADIKVMSNVGEVTEIRKNSYNLIEDLSSYISDKNPPSMPDGKTESDIQNHIAYLRDDVAEPVDVGEFNSIWKTVLGTILQAKLINVYNKNRRTYRDLLDGKPAYTEDIAYKIEKYAKRPSPGITPGDTDEYILSQNIIIPNTSDINIFNYVDTQLKYGTDMVYKYKIYAIKIVFGCAYKYKMLGHAAGLNWNGRSPVTVNSEGNMDAYLQITDGVGIQGVNKEPLDPETPEAGIKALAVKATVEIYPNIVMVEDMFYESPEIIISDHPPAAPDANIVPYRGKSDKILILLNGMMDTYRADPIKILDTDTANFNWIKKAQISPDGKILFSSDDPVGRFQIFRTKNKPSSYTDFELYRTISGENVTHFEDTVVPNQKYYYTFRALDAHQNISNPTAVYEVEMIDDHGSVKPLIRVFNFEEPDYFDAIKECQKYLMIRPNLKQLYYNPDKSNLDDHMFNETSDGDDSSVAKRRFKIRITSKNTGKKIDLNVSFLKKRLLEET